jgi:hypothetical protein
MLTRGQGLSGGLFLPPVRRLCPKHDTPGRSETGHCGLLAISRLRRLRHEGRWRLAACGTSIPQPLNTEPSESHSPHVPVTILQSEGVAAAYIFVQRRP